MMRFKRIYKDDIVEVLNGDCMGQRFHVVFGHEGLADDDLKRYREIGDWHYDIFITNTSAKCTDENTSRLSLDEYFLWKSPFKNKLKRIRDRLYNRNRHIWVMK